MKGSELGPKTSVELVARSTGFRVYLSSDHGNVGALIEHVLDTLRESKEWS